MRQRFVTGQGGALRLLPPECVLAGAPTAATVTLRSARGLALPAPIEEVAATLDPVATTIAQAAEEGDREVEVASAAGIVVGRSYLVTADGDRFTVEVAGVAGTRVRLADPLLREVEADATFEGVELSYPLAGSQCPDPRAFGTLYRAAWTYTIAGVLYSADELYEVRRRVLKPVLSAGDVTGFLPLDWPALVAGGPTVLRDRMGDAFDDLLDDLVARGVEPDLVQDPARLRKSHRELVLANLYRAFGPAWRESADAQRGVYEAELEKLLASPGWYDKDSSGTQTGEEQSASFSTIKLSR